MIDFDRAISVARESIHKLVPDANNIKLEEALISDNEKLFEITYSYDIETMNIKNLDNLNNFKSNHFKNLANIMGTRRQYKVFLIDAQSGKFRGFRNKD